MIREYTHELGKEILTISGRYELEREVRLEHNGREILYVVGNAVVDSSCCGYGGCRYAIVPGFIVHWKSKTNKGGFRISEVAPITERLLKEEIRKILEKKEWVSQVQFW